MAERVILEDKGPEIYERETSSVYDRPLWHRWPEPIPEHCLAGAAPHRHPSAGSACSPIWRGLLIFCYYRTFSRNISKRTEENYKFYTLKDQVDNKFKGWKEQWANRKVYPLLPLPPVPPEAARTPRPRPHPDLLPPLRHPVHQEELSHVRICYPESGRTQPGAQARYRSAYCGLCRRIGVLHGTRGRLTLSYDLTFLDLLLCSLYEGESAV